MQSPASPLTAGEIATLVGGRLVDCPADRVLNGVLPLGRATVTEVSFLHNPKYAAAARESGAGLLIAGLDSGLTGKPRVEVKDPHGAVALLLGRWYPPPRPPAGISPKADVDPSARIDPGATVLAFAFVGPRAVIAAGAVVHPFCHVGADCELGEGVTLHPGVILYHETVIGPRSILHAGAVIGADGFGFALGAAGHIKVPQIGRVRIGADVEIGAGSTVDRAALGETLIEDGVKIDNLVMVAHNVVVGKHSILVAQSGISGSTVLGPGVVIAGQSGAVGHINLGAGAKVGAKSAVTRDLAPGEFVTGHPARPHGDWLRQQALIEKLPEWRVELRELRAKIETLESRVSGLGSGVSDKQTKPTRHTPHANPVALKTAARKPAPVKKSKPKKKLVPKRKNRI